MLHCNTITTRCSQQGIHLLLRLKTILINSLFLSMPHPTTARWFGHSVCFHSPTRIWEQNHFNSNSPNGTLQLHSSTNWEESYVHRDRSEPSSLCHKSGSARGKRAYFPALIEGDSFSSFKVQQIKAPIIQDSPKIKPLQIGKGSSF